MINHCFDLTDDFSELEPKKNIKKYINFSEANWKSWIKLTLSDKETDPQPEILAKDAFSKIAHVFNVINLSNKLANKKDEVINKFNIAVVDLLIQYSNNKSEYEKNNILINILSITKPIEFKSDIEYLILEKRYLKWEDVNGFSLFISLLAAFIHLGSFKKSFNHFLTNFLETELINYNFRSAFYLVSLRYMSKHSGSEHFISFLDKIFKKDNSTEDLQSIIKAINESARKHSFLPVYYWYKHALYEKTIMEENPFNNLLVENLDRKFNEFKTDVFYYLLFSIISRIQERTFPPLILVKLLSLFKISDNDVKAEIELELKNILFINLKKVTIDTLIYKQELFSKLKIESTVRGYVFSVFEGNELNFKSHLLNTRTIHVTRENEVQLITKVTIGKETIS